MRRVSGPMPLDPGEHREIEYYLLRRLEFTNNETMNAIQAGKLIS